MKCNAIFKTLAIASILSALVIQVDSVPAKSSAYAAKNKAIAGFDSKKQAHEEDEYQYTDGYQAAALDTSQGLSEGSNQDKESSSETDLSSDLRSKIGNNEDFAEEESQANTDCFHPDDESCENDKEDWKHKKHGKDWKKRKEHKRHSKSMKNRGNNPERRRRGRSCSGASSIISLASGVIGTAALIALLFRFRNAKSKNFKDLVGEKSGNSETNSLHQLSSIHEKQPFEGVDAVRTQK